MSARSVNNSNPKESSDDDDSVSVSDYSDKTKPSISKINSGDVAELRDMLAASDNDDELERSFQKLISPGHVESNKKFYESLKDQPPPAKPPLQDDTDDDDDELGYGILKEDDNETEQVPLEEGTRLLILQREAEKARGDPSNYHTSDDEDSAALLDDLVLRESKSTLKSDENGEDDGSESNDTSIDDSDNSSALARDPSSRWEASVAAEGDKALNKSRASFQRQKELIMNSAHQQPKNESGKSFDEGEDLTAREITGNLRQDLEAQVKERIQIDDDELKKQLERSFNRDTSRGISVLSSSSSSSSGEEAMEEGTSSKGHDEGGPPKVIETQERSPVKRVMAFMASMGCIYFMLMSVTLLVIAVIVLAVFFARA
jgi:hypothetical protein